MVPPNERIVRDANNPSTGELTKRIRQISSMSRGLIRRTCSGSVRPSGRRWLTDIPCPSGTKVVDGHPVLVGKALGDDRSVAGLGIALDAEQRRRAVAR